MNIWAHAGPSIVAAFLASLVEFVEALTVVLAVWTIRGWKPAIAGSIAGVVLLFVLVLLFGPLLGRIPLNWLQLGVGVLLTLFGMRWLRKAILRSAGVIALHDEAKEFAEETSRLRGAGAVAGSGLDMLAISTTFQAVVLEGLEVVFIVIAVGATAGMLVPAGLGAATAGVVVIGLGVVIHRPLSRVPENALKFIVGVLLSTFGIFWVGEGAGLGWPGSDLSILGVAVALLMVALIGVPMARRAAQTPIKAVSA